MGRGIVDAQTLRTEQFGFEGRTSDPVDAQPGEYWMRVDQTSTNPDVIAELRRQDNSGVTTCPIFAASEESNLGADVKRGPSVVLDDGSVGFIVMTTGSGKVGSPRAVTSAGAQYVSHNALELDTIPDTVITQFNTQQAFDAVDEGSTTSSWADETGTLTLTSNTSFSIVGDGINGYRAIDFSGVSDVFAGDFASGKSNPTTIIAVVDFETGSDGKYVCDGASATEKMMGVTQDGNWFLNEGGSTQQGSSDLSVQLIAGVFDSTDDFYEGNQNTASGDAGTTTLNGITIGGQGDNSQYWNGQIGFHEVHDGLPSNGLQTRLAEVAAMWDITL